MGHDPRLNDQMWHLAESGSHAEREAFLRRHPECAEELKRRAALVSSMRHSRPRSSTIPARRYQPATVGKPYWRLIPAGALALASLAFATYTIGNTLASDQRIVESPSEGKTMIPWTDELPVPPVAHAKQGSPPSAAGQKDSSACRDGVETLNPDMTPAPTAQLVRVEFDETPLKQALREIANRGGIRIEMAPGFPDIRVSGTYEGMTAMDTLVAIGEKHGFSVFAQTPGLVLVVPAVDTSRGPSTAPADPTAPPDSRANADRTYRQR